MRKSLDRLRMALDEALALQESTAAEALFAHVAAIEAAVTSAVGEITSAVSGGEAAPVVELQALKEAFERQSRKLQLPRRKLLHRPAERVKVALERVQFFERSRGRSAACDCEVWRAVASGRGLAAVPSFPASRVVEEADDAYESYRIHECGRCGSRWLQDFNPDSDPSVTRWWAR